MPTSASSNDRKVLYYVMNRVKEKVFIRTLLTAVTLLLLAACGSVTSVPQNEVATDEVSDFAYVASVTIDKDTVQADIEARYDGTAIVFEPDAGFAILGFSQEQGGLTTLSTTANQNAFSSPEVSVAGHGVWSGGHGAWSGGHGAWSGGWNSWAGNYSELPTLPNNNGVPWNQIKVPQAHALSKNFGAGMKVAVIDTGLDLNHPAFVGRLAPMSEWKDFVGNDSTPQEVSGGDAYGHGTAVAGIILQIAPRATILPIRAMKPDGSGDVDDIVAAVSWAVQKNAQIINLSLGTDVDIAALKTMIDYANSKGIYVVASAGNEGNNSSLTYPAAYAKTGANASYLLSVGSVDSGSSLSSFTNRGAALEMVSPGEKIHSAYPGNQVAYVTGTSFAAPQVAGALALGASDNRCS